MTTDQIPKVDAAHVGTVLRLKARIEDRIAETFVDAVLRGDEFEVFVDVVAKMLPKTLVREVVRESLIHLAGIKLTSKLVARTAWRLAGNLKTLKACNPVRPWRLQHDDEWVPVQIIDFKMHLTKYRKVGAIFFGRVLTGSPTAEVIEYFWTHKYCSYVSGRMGFTAPWGRYPFKKMEQFVGMRFHAYLDKFTELDGRRQLRFTHLRVVPSAESYNRSILKRRRRESFKCPENFRHACDRCWVGLDHCPVALHPRTFVKRYCDRCDKEAWVDPGRDILGLCVMCQQKEDLRND